MDSVLFFFDGLPLVVQAGVLVLLAYAVGCFNTGYYLVRWLKGGADIRQLGSGTAGATNAGRVLGRQGFLLVTLFDGVKGILPVLLARWLGQTPLVLSLVAFAVVVGHIFPAQLRFRGGKGIVPALGGIIAATPLLWLIMVGCWIVLLSVLRRYHLSGVLAVALLLPACLLVGLNWQYCVGYGLLAALLFVRSLPPCKPVSAHADSLVSVSHSSGEA